MPCLCTYVRLHVRELACPLKRYLQERAQGQRPTAVCQHVRVALRQIPPWVRPVVQGGAGVVAAKKHSMK